MSNLEHALALAREGWPVFPIWHCVDGVCACGKPERGQIGKHPRCWHGHNDATTDETQLRIWWADPAYPAPAGFSWECSPDSNIGIAVPDGVLVVDIDPRNGGDATFDALQLSHGWPETAEVLSGSGGMHLYYRVPAGMQYPKTLNDHGGPGIDLKQLGGYVLAPPSIHKSGGRYEYASNTQLLLLADAPMWLLALGTPRRAKVARKRERSEHDDALSERALAEGDALIAILEPHYVEGSKHAISRAFGGYCKKNGKSAALVEYVVSQLPSTDPDMRVESALTYFDYENPSGWSELQSHLPADAASALERIIKAQRAEALKSRVTREQAQTLRESAAQPKAKARESWRPGAGVAAAEAIIEDVCPFELFDPNIEPEEPEYTVLTFCAGKTSAITAYANTSKTPFALLMGISVAMGINFFGQKTKQAKVLYLAFEGAGNARRKAQRVCRGLGTSLAALADQFIIGKADGGALDCDYVGALEVYCLKNRIDVVIVDTYGHALSTEFERNSNDFSSCLKLMGNISETHGLLWINLLHHRKSAKGQRGGIEMIDGHNSVAGAIQSAVTLHRPDDADQFTIEATCSRALDTPFQDFAFKWVDTTESGEALTTERAFAERVSGRLGLKAEPLDVEALHQESGEAENVQMVRAIVTLLQRAAQEGRGHVERKHLLESVSGKTQAKVETLATLVSLGTLTLTVDGRRYLYSLPVKGNS